MAYRLTRKTTGGVMRVMIAEPDGADAGLAAGGTFYFASAGEEDSSHQVSEHAARVIMSDPGMAPQFDCYPPLPASKAVIEADPAHEVAHEAQGDQPGPDSRPQDITASGRRAKRRRGEPGE